MTDLSERLRKLLQKHLEEWQTNQGALAQHLGVGRSAVSRMLSGERQISATELFGIISYFGLTFDQVEKALQLSEADNLDLYVSAISGRGKNSFGDNLEIKPYFIESSSISIPTIALGSAKIEKGNRLRWMRVYDDAMAPTIEKGDLIIIDESIKGATGLYAMEATPGSYTVRRLDSGRWEGESLLVHVSADNPKFRNYETSLDTIRAIGLVLVRITDRV